MGLTVLHQDQNILVCVKPAGVTSEEGGLPQLLREQCGGEVFCVHRLDKAVGGVMVYARTREAAAALSSAVAARQIEKGYLAVAQGRPNADSGEMCDLLYHDAAKNKSYVVRRPRRGVREARLRYRLLASLDAGSGALSLLRIRLETGRSHQIRVQLASRGMPLVGDGRYGSAYHGCVLALWSYFLAFAHPITGEKLCFSEPPPSAWPWTQFDLSTMDKDKS